ncbi:hypothetical protein [Chitinophaga tropicalis]|uniref:Uncharacterized protein n=1 Tax=Chitinophaga tropicalis TaxID=2683588 RepID=A0A7K1U2U4_9BACT|nr:hypothetical protein [Chitinophaga tropicalis]MVT08325.1 hypothetical protein [Chitinophaga tropicalis]
MPELKYITTDKNSGYPEYLDFVTLRRLGIQHIAELSGKIWTDHNLHDPGITMLDALCYVLTDLDYRTKLDFKDLVAARGGTKENNFYTAAQILGNNPLTITDIRKMLIDIKGVRNAWLKPVEEGEYTLAYDCETGQLLNTPVTENLSPVPLKGLYRIYIEPDDVYAAAYEKDACGNDVFPMENMLKTIDERLHAHRNLCEDFADIVVLEKEPISLCLHIELAANFDPDEVLVNIYGAIQDFFSPAPSFYSLQQLLDKGRSMEEIFEGRPFNFDENRPLQQNGFIDTQELESLERLTELHASDLYRIIMKVPGVAGITRLQMKSSNEGGYLLNDKDGKPIVQNGEEWCLKLKDNHRPVLSPEASNVIFYRNKLPFTANNELVRQRYIKNISDYTKFPKAPDALDTVVPKGRDLDLAQYTSVQYEFPKVYLVGKNEVPLDATAARKAQSLQLQAYLLFYDRLLADYFAQLSNIRQLFSLQQTDDRRTYFSADLSGIPQLPSLLRYEKQLPVTTQGATYKGMTLAFEPAAGGEGHKEYSSMYLRDESIRRIISACSNNNVKRVIDQFPDSGEWYLLLTDTADNILLESAIYFNTRNDAEQAARDIVFLAGLPGSYSRTNHRKENRFSFDLVYNDTGYTEMLTALYETSAQYQERKDRFQNHLLARFSEDFTDYALMMYNISGRKNDPEGNIADKAAFLSAYPETSANRALAFDYKHPEKGFPVCGLQERVAGLMGIRQSPSASLSNFDLVNAIRLHQFFCYLPDQKTPLFVSDSLHAEAEVKDAFNTFLQLGKDKENYKPYGCHGEGVYGFYIQSPVNAEKWVAARCMIEYATPEERDRMIDWFVTFFVHDGQYKVFTRTNEGYYFLLPDDQGHTLLKSRQGYETQEEALSAGYDCLEVLQEDAAWQVKHDIPTASYSVVIVQGDEQLAHHPQAFADEEDATKKLEELKAWFRKHKLVYQKETTELYNWQLAVQGKAAWQGALPFKSTAQLPAAFAQFIELAAKAENYRITGEYNLQVVRTEEEEIVTIIGTHLFVYESDAAAQEAINNYVLLFSGLWIAATGTVTETTAAFYSFRDLQTQMVVLTTTDLVPDGPSVAQYTRNIMRYAADPARLSIVPGEGCGYMVKLHDPCGELLAVSPQMPDQVTAGNLMEQILLRAGQEALWIEKGETVTAFGWVWEEEKSTGVWDTRQAAAVAFISWLLKKEQHPLLADIGWSVTTLYHYYFKIKEGSGFLLLQEPSYFTSYQAVRTAFYNTVRFGKQRPYYLLTTLENCTYGFKVTDDQQRVLAVHPFEYTTTAARDAAVDRTIKFLQEYGQVINEVKLAGAWKYSWQWLDCCSWQSATALDALEEKTALKDAETALKHILLVAANLDKKEVYRIAEDENGFRVFLVEEGADLAVHPDWLDCRREAEDVIVRLTAWARFTLSVYAQGKVSEETDVHTDLYQPGSEKAMIGYRLWDREFRIARYSTQFNSPAERETALLELLQRYKRKLPYYTVLEAGNSVVFVQNGLYYFQLRRNDTLLWQSVNAYGDAAAATAAFKAACWQILQRSLLQESYSSWSNSETQLTLYDEKGLPLAVLNEAFGSYDTYLAAIRARQLFAKQHGVYVTKDGAYAFHIYNVKAGAYEWESISTYADPEAAAAALKEFMQLLLYRGNYCLDNENTGCYYSLTLGKVLLDIQHVTRRCEGDSGPEVIDETEAWNRLQIFLDSQQQGDSNFFPYTDYAGGCRYAFRMVDSELYRVAQHTEWYQGMEEREEKRLELLCDIYCKERLYGWFVKPDPEDPANRDEKILQCYFKQPGKVNFADLWMSYSAIGTMKEKHKFWQPATEKLTEEVSLYYYQLTGNDEKVIWNTVTRYSTPEQAAEAEQYFYVYLLEMARSEASYYYEPVVGCEKAFTLSLKDMDGKIIAVAPDVICAPDIEQDRNTRIFNAMMYPVVETGKGYSFEINNIKQDAKSGELSYMTIWESVRVYDTPDEAFKDLTKASQLLTDLRNYQRGDEDACGPFSVTLVDPQAILADHPFTYTSISARNAAIEQVQTAISAEGMHLLEHILLRPRTQEQYYESMQLQLSWYPGSGQELPVLLKIGAETVYKDSNAFLDDIRSVAKDGRIFIDQEAEGYIISWWKKDERIASAQLKTSDVVTKALGDRDGFIGTMQELLSGVSSQLVTTETVPVCSNGADVVLPSCTDICLCDRAQEVIDEENKPYCDCTFFADPYSFWATVVLPAWPQRFRLARFRQFFEDTLRREAPAHIRLNILWVSPQQMLQFEKAWKQWTMALSREDSCDYTSSLEQLNKILMELKNVYPAAYLYDDDGGADKPLIILDEAMLG